MFYFLKSFFCATIHLYFAHPQPLSKIAVFFQIITRGLASFGQGMATPMSANLKEMFSQVVISKVPTPSKI